MTKNLMDNFVDRQASFKVPSYPTGNCNIELGSIDLQLEDRYRMFPHAKSHRNRNIELGFIDLQFEDRDPMFPYAKSHRVGYYKP